MRIKRFSFDGETAWFCLLAAVVLFAAWHRLFWQNQIPVDGNMIAVTFPNWRLARYFMAQHCWPLWNPMRNMGAPHLADPITSALYPPMLVLSFLGDFGVFLKGWVLFHTLLAACFSGGLAYRWYRDKFAGFAAALIAGLNGFFMARVIFQHHFASAAWLSALLYFQETGSPAGVGVCLALQWLAGYPTFSYMSLLALSGFAAFQGRAGVRRLVQAGFWAFGLSAIQLFPFLEFLAHSSRGVFLSANSSGQFSLPILQLLKELFLPGWAALSPGVEGDPAMVTFYVGVMGIALAAFGVFRGSRREKILAAAVIAALVLSLGKYLPGYRWLIFGRIFRYPSNWLLIAAAGLGLLCGAGVRRLPGQFWKWAAVICIGVELALFAQWPKSAWGGARPLSDPPPLANAILSRDSYPRIFHSKHLMEVWAHSTLESESDYLIMKDFLAPSYGMAFGIGDISSYQALRLRRAENYRLRLSDDPDSRRLLDWAGARWVFSLDPKASRIEAPSLLVQGNPSAKSRIFLAEGDGRAIVTDYGPGWLKAIVEADHPATAVFSEVDFPGWKTFVDGNPVSRTRFEETFMAVLVPPGRHEVLFRYVPFSFWAGFWVTILTLGLFARRLLPHRA